MSDAAFDFQYAIENTQVVYEPDRRIDTFGSTEFQFQLVSELMDSANACRIREGRVEAHRPLVFRPEPGAHFDFEGFSPEAAAFGHWLRENIADIAVLRYGFSFRRMDVTEHTVNEPVSEVIGKLVADAKLRGNPMQAIIQGVDDTWEISLLKFTVDLIAKSQGINIFDFKRKGML
ncbi:MAG: hypothetical protein JNJ83_23915 [Verrucomicrobiaceae bacterium]|nr:hypothetical protein [Verrucomicrobiaceae bacterium]